MCAQSCLSVCDPADSRLPGSSVRGISQARILEWITISSSRGSSQFTIKDILMRTDEKTHEEGKLWRKGLGASVSAVGVLSLPYLHGLTTLQTFLNPRDFNAGFILQE